MTLFQLEGAVLLPSLPIAISGALGNVFTGERNEEQHSFFAHFTLTFREGRPCCRTPSTIRCNHHRI